MLFVFASNLKSSVVHRLQLVLFVYVPECCDITWHCDRSGQNQRACQQPYHHIQDDAIVVSIDNFRMFFNFLYKRALLYIMLPSLYFESMNAAEILLCSWASRCYYHSYHYKCLVFSEVHRTFRSTYVLATLIGVGLSDTAILARYWSHYSPY